ncbi:MAG TPA: galactose-1-phosphate uridylyltransferase [Bryobacteraceae bacterium]|nr:galactose-1-phosphate uridylyltransferase [Bryobacteraceae bacterium]
MNELRWHPFLRQWVAVATHRQDRPQMPADWCPFCPGSGRVPDHYDVLLYPNDFPAFSPDAPPFDPEPCLFRTTGARGFCDVVLYSPSHTTWPSQIPPEHWSKVIELWTHRTRELFAAPDVQYVMVFENTGEAIGVTMPHPHGQIYAFPFIPPLVDVEVRSQADYLRDCGRCLHCDVLARELSDNVRIVAHNDTFVAYAPFAARFPSEVHIVPRRHFGTLMNLEHRETTDLASLLSIIRRKYDNLYGFLMPLMMVLRQAPATGDHSYFHFELQFLPLQRSPNKLKYLASVETAGGTYLADTLPEERAEALRKAEPVS